MKKAAGLVFFVAFICVWPFACALATGFASSNKYAGYSNEPNGFRGILFGTNIKELSYIKLRKVQDAGEEKRYVVDKDKMNVGSAQLDRILYIFYDDKFYAVYIQYKSIGNYLKLRDIFVDLYGKGNKTQRGSFQIFIWMGHAVDIFLTYDEVKDEGDVMYTYKPIGDQIQSDRGRKGKGDL